MSEQGQANGLHSSNHGSDKAKVRIQEDGTSLGSCLVMLSWTAGADL